MANKIFVEDSSIGSMGSELHLGATALNGVDGQYYAIQFLTDVKPLVMNFVDSTGWSGVSVADFPTIPAGTIIYGDLLYITTNVAADAFILYKR